MASTDASIKWLALTKATELPTEAEIEAIYDRLPPVDAEFLVANPEWKGGYLKTGHSASVPLEQVGWVGKTFRSVDDVVPIVILDADGKRVQSEVYGNARLRKVEYRGVLSMAMVYDKFPIIDCFRKVNDKMIAGAMDSGVPGAPDDKVFWFYLYHD